MILRTVSESSTIMIVGTAVVAGDADGESTGVAAATYGDHIPAGQDHRVDDQHDLAGAQHRRTGDPGDAGEERAGVLDHDLLAADHLVELDRAQVRAGAQEHDRRDPAALGLEVAVAEKPRQVTERVAAVLPLRLAGGVEGGELFRLDLPHLLDHDGGDGEAHAAGAHQHRLRDREGER